MAKRYLRAEKMYKDISFEHLPKGARYIFTLLSNQISSVMNYKIIDIEGVGDSYASKLIDAGITTVDELLKAGATARGRDALAEKTGISSKLILKWVNHADLFRIQGIGPQFAELLEASGVDTVKELRHRRADNLTAKVEEINEAKHLCRRVPSEKEIERMISQAMELEPVVTY